MAVNRNRELGTQGRPLPQLVKLHRGASEVGVPYTSLRDAHFRGDLPIVKIGRAWYVDRLDLASFLERAKA